MTSNAGTYVLSSLTPGDYNVTISAAAFMKFAQEHVTVDALAGWSAIGVESGRLQRDGDGDGRASAAGDD